MFILVSNFRTEVEINFGLTNKTHKMKGVGTMFTRMSNIDRMFGAMDLLRNRMDSLNLKRLNPNRLKSRLLKKNKTLSSFSIWGQCSKN